MIIKPLHGLSISLKYFILLRQSNINQNLLQLKFSPDRINQIYRYCKSSNLNLIDLTKVETKPLSQINNETHLSSLDIYNMLATLSVIFNKCKYDPNIDQEAFYRIIINILNLQGHDLEINQIAELLKLFLKAEIPNFKIIMNYLVKLLNNNVGKFGAKDYDELNIINSKLESKNNELINNNLNNVLNSKTQLDLPNNNLNLLLKSLSNVKSDLNKQNIILQSLTKIDFERISVSQILHLHKTLNLINNDSSEYLILLNETQNYIINNIKQLSITNILKIFEHYNLFRSFGFYNEKLLDICADEIINRNTNINESSTLLHAFVNIRHKHENLLLYIISKYNNSCTSYKTASSILMASVQYKCELLLKEYIFDLMNKYILVLGPLRKLKYTYYLALSGHYNSKIIEEVFKYQYSDKNNYPRLISLWQKLTTLENYEGYIPPNEFIEKIYEDGDHKKTTDEIISTLEEGLGGSLYVKMNLMTKLYHKIDYVTIFRKGGYPIAFDDSKYKSIKFIEDLKVPPNCQIVIFKEVPKEWYSLNTSEIMGQYTVYFETLEALSYTVIPLNVKELCELSKTERLLSLMKIIKSKLECTDNIK